MTIIKIQNEKQRIEAELAAAEKEYNELNDKLISQAGDIRSKPKEVEQIAAHIVAIEGRIKAIKAALTHNDQKTGLLQARTKTKEYKDGQKRRAELEKSYQGKSGDIRRRLEAIREEVIEVLGTHAEYNKLINADLETSEDVKMSLRSNPDVQYLLETVAILNRQAWVENHVKSLQAMSREATDPDRRAEMDKRRAANEAEQAKRPKMNLGLKPIPPAPESFVAPREPYREPRYPNE